MNLRKKTTTICTADGCTNPAWARSLCNSHYQKWRRALPHCLIRESAEAQILDALPGTRRQIEQSTGLRQETILKHLKRLRNRHRVFIIEKLPPPAGTFMCWTPVYAKGRGVDAVVNAATKAARKQAMQAQLNVALAYADPFGLARRAA